VKSPPKVLRNPHSTGAVVGLSAYDKQHDSLWFATEEGIEQLTLNNAKWNQRYFDFEVTADNRLGITLSLQKPSDEKMWLGRILHNYPIKDLRGFVTAWQQATPPKYQGETRVSPLLLPHYMDAAINSRNWENDWIYRGLLYIISSHQDAPSKEVATVFIANELKRPQSLANRGELFVVAKKLGIPITQEMRSAYFNDVLYNYFIRPKTNRWAKNNVVKIAFEHPEYLPQLRDYYRSHIITFDVEDGFLDEVRGYSSWPNYQVLADVINEGQTRFKYRRDLLEMCGRNETPRNENALLSILQARLETDSQAKYLDDPNVYDGTERCIQASINWINYGGKDQVGRRVNLMLNVAIEHKELANIILEILNSRFNWTIHNIEEWKRQWTKTYVSEVNTNGACANEMKTCINNPYGCVSLGIPAETSKCDGMCASEIIGKLRTAGVSVAAPHASPNAPLGCVGYRADIAGTEAGAKCIANVLGYEYMPWGCSGDGYSYNVRAR
jgi:hypothetical protein